MASSTYPVETKLHPGDQAFVATPYPPPGQIPMQSMGQPTPFASQPTIVSLQPSEPGAFTLNTRIVFRLGICTVVFGFIAFVCGICATAIFGELDYNVVSGGIWGGAIIIASGIIAIVSSRKPQSRGLNWVNLALHSFGLAVCIGVLVLCGLSLEYYDGCIRRYYWSYWYSFTNKNCPKEKDGAIVTYSLIVVSICAQLGISTAMVVFTSRAHPCCRNCKCDCGGAEQTGYRNMPHQHSFQTGYATMSPNVQPIPSGQILYMMTPVAVTTQHPQHAPVNPIPQATLVVNS